MSNYLWDKCKGHYRVYAEFDRRTDDVPRTINDTIDPDYDDWYLCNSGKSIVIKHSYRDELACFTTIGKGHNFINFLYEKLLNDQSSFRRDKINKLLEEKWILNYDETSEEVIIIFKLNRLDEYNEYFKLKTSGANIHPLSKKNHKKIEYQLPEECLQQFNEISDKVRKQYSDLKMAHTMRQAAKNIMGISSTPRHINMKFRDYIHQSGNWEKFIKEYEKLVSQICE